MERLTNQEKGLAVGLLAAILVGAAVLVYRHLSPREAEPAPPAVEVESPLVAPAEEGPIKVDVSGAVWRPGVYELPPGSRVADALDRAMPRDDADLDAVNRAAMLYDGDKVVVPAKAQASPPAATVGVTSREAVQVNINTADAASLEKLPGIGPARAAAIVRYRRAHGPFPSLDALCDVPGIGPGIVDGLREFATVGPPERTLRQTGPDTQR